MKKYLPEKREKCVVLIALLLGVVGMTKVFAQHFTVGDLNYLINQDGTSVTVTGHVDDTLATGALVIPETVPYNGSEYPVVETGAGAFRECHGLTSLDIGDSITIIGWAAFAGCSGLTGYLIIPDGVIAIVDFAFERCEGFSGDLFLPEGLSYIGTAAFSDCSGLTGPLTIPSTVTTVDDGAFWGCSGFDGSLTLPDGLTSIGNDVFYGCAGLSGSLNLPSGLTSIGNGAFEFCSGFTGSLIIGEQVTSIGDFAFSGCSGFSGPLMLPSTLTSIGRGAFEACSGLTGELHIPNSITEIRESTFFQCSNLTGNLTLGDRITSIGDYAFYGCSGFSGPLTIPSSLTSIGYAAFAYCSGFTGSLILGEQVTSIGDFVFFRCSGFSGPLILPSTLTSIGLSTFGYCSGLTGVLSLPEGLTSIGSWAFIECSGFTGPLTLPSALVAIGESVFEECRGFTGPLTIPNSVTSIGNSAFSNCSGLTGSLTLPNSLNFIGIEAFKGCIGFTGPLTLPNSLAWIMDKAFYGCSGFSGSVTLPKTLARIGDYAFYNCTGLSSVIALRADPPAIGAYPFVHGGSSELTVCCGNKEAYLNSDWANSFNTITEDCETYSIIVEENNFGSVSASVSSAQLGEDVVVSFTPISGYVMRQIIVCKADDENQTIPVNRVNSKYIFYMPSFDVKVSAVFEYSPYYSIIVDPEIIGGRVTASSEESIVGNVIALYVVPDDGFELQSLTVYNADDFSQIVEITDNFFIMPPFDVLISAVFEKVLYSITVSPNATGGSVIPSANEAVMGDAIALDIVPDVGYELGLLTVNRASDSIQTVDVIDNTFIMPSFDVLVSATFEKVLYSITVGPNITGGKISLSANEAVMGDTIVLVVVPKAGYELRTLTVFNSNNPDQTVTVNYYTFVMPPFDVTVSASFVFHSVDENGIETAVYPNPTQGNVKIEAKNLQYFSVFNEFGQQIYEGQTAGDEFEFDFSGYESGIYLIRIETASGIASKRVVVTR